MMRPSACCTRSCGRGNDGGHHDRAARRVTTQGLPMALYTDRAHWAFHTPQAKGPVDKTQLTQVGRALERLGIEHIPAYSPQARGRSERLNRTFQDRLVNELRVAKITTLAAANRLSARSLHPATTTPPSAARRADPASAFVAARARGSRADPLSPGGARRRAATTPSPSRAAPSSCAPAGPSIVRGPARHDPPASRRASTPSGRGAAARPLSGRARPAPRSPHGRAARGSCRGRGRQERAHRPLENAQSAFPTAPTGLTLKSGQITCQTEADSSLVNNMITVVAGCESVSRGPWSVVRGSWFVARRSKGGGRLKQPGDSRQGKQRASTTCSRDAAG